MGLFPSVYGNVWDKKNLFVEIILMWKFDFVGCLLTKNYFLVLRSLVKNPVERATAAQLKSLMEVIYSIIYWIIDAHIDFAES